MEEQVLT